MSKSKSNIVEQLNETCKETARLIQELEDTVKDLRKINK